MYRIFYVAEPSHFDGISHNVRQTLGLTLGLAHISIIAISIMRIMLPLSLSQPNSLPRRVDLGDLIHRHAPGGAGHQLIQPAGEDGGGASGLQQLRLERGGWCVIGAGVRIGVSRPGLTALAALDDFAGDGGLVWTMNDDGAVGHGVINPLSNCTITTSVNSLYPARTNVEMRSNCTSSTLKSGLFGAASMTLIQF